MDRNMKLNYKLYKAETRRQEKSMYDVNCMKIVLCVMLRYVRNLDHANKIKRVLPWIVINVSTYP